MQRWLHVALAWAAVLSTFTVLCSGCAPISAYPKIEIDSVPRGLEVKVDKVPTGLTTPAQVAPRDFSSGDINRRFIVSVASESGYERRAEAWEQTAEQSPEGLERACCCTLGPLDVFCTVLFNKPLLFNLRPRSLMLDTTMPKTGLIITTNPALLNGHEPPWLIIDGEFPSDLSWLLTPSSEWVVEVGAGKHSLKYLGGPEIPVELCEGEIKRIDLRQSRPKPPDESR